MTIYDITDVNATFENMMAGCDRLSQNEEAKIFGQLFFGSFSEKNRALYHIAFPPRFSRPIEADDSRILASQEARGFHD